MLPRQWCVDAISNIGLDLDHGGGPDHMMKTSQLVTNLSVLYYPAVPAKGALTAAVFHRKKVG